MSDPFIGEIRLFGFTKIPIGWVACNGQPLPIAQYQPLYTVIGTTYGGDAVSTFNVPDLRGRVPIAQGAGPNLPVYVMGQMAGEEKHGLLDAEMPAHSHALISSTDTANTAAPAANVHLATASSGNLYAPQANAAPYAVMAPAIASVGNNVPHNNMMPTLVGNYCIATDGIYPSRP